MNSSLVDVCKSHQRRTQKEHFKEFSHWGLAMPRMACEDASVASLLKIP